MRTLIALGLVAGVAGSASADRPRLGVTAGLDISTVHESGLATMGVEQPDHKLGLAAGAVVLVPLGPTSAIQTGALFSQKGSRDEDISLTLAYLAIPALLRLRITRTGSVRPYLAAGGELGILLAAKVKSDGMTRDVKDETSTIDFGLAAGGGVEIAAGASLVIVEGRYTHGMVGLDANRDMYDGDGHNRAFSLLAGFLF